MPEDSPHGGSEPLTGEAALPRELGSRFEMVAVIAEGGMSTVYDARDRRTGQRVAIKRLRGRGSSGEQLLSRFLREAEVLRRLDHPNIVRMLEIFSDGGRHHIVMEYVPGGSLRDLLNRERALPLRRALSILLELADALARVHTLGIVHRDIKPENILLAQDGAARLTDFGLARVNQERLTASGVVLGTAAYMSPEALWGKPLDGRTDLWALGVVLYEMLTGSHPFSGTTPAHIVTAILHDVPPPLHSVWPGAPPKLVDLVTQMLEKDLAVRIASARQVGAVTEALLKDISHVDAKSTEPIAARRAAPMPTSPIADTQCLDQGPPRLGLQSTRRQVIGRWRFVAFVLAGLGCASALALASWSVGTASRSRGEVDGSSLPAAALLLDDFEDGDRLPRDRRFARWQRYEFKTNGVERVHVWTAAPGATSNFCLHLAWLLRDEPNGKPDDIGVGLRSVGADGYADLSAYSRLVFTQRYEPVASFPEGWTAYPEAPDRHAPDWESRLLNERNLLEGIEACEHRVPRAHIQLYCSEFNTWFEAVVVLSEEWRTLVVPFSELHEPSWRPATQTPLARCLTVVDGVNIIAEDDQLADGECHSGMLLVDNISFR